MRQLKLRFLQNNDAAPRQLDLDAVKLAPTLHAASAEDAPLLTWLEQRLHQRLDVVFTHNRSTMLSVRERRGRLCLRLHEVFRRAGERERAALLAFVSGNGAPDTTQVLDAFVQAELPEPVAEAAPRHRVAGRFHDLQRIFDELNVTYFHNTVQATICWGASSLKRYRRSIQLGVYVRNQRLIRVHPSLDQAFVPRHYVAWIVFHEMLHDVFGVEKGRRRKVHPTDFRAVEESYPDFALCKQWEQQNLHRLLRFRVR